MSDNRFHKRLKVIRESQKMSQEKFGDLFGVSKSALLRYESGKNVPNLTFITEVCEKFGINTNWLLFGRTPFLMANIENEKKTAAELCEDLLKALKIPDAAPPGLTFSPGVRRDIENLTEGTVENYLRILSSMEESEETRKSMFIHYYYTLMRKGGGLNV